jgi:hypothetical protein
MLGKDEMEVLRECKRRNLPTHVEFNHRWVNTSATDPQEEIREKCKGWIEHYADIFKNTKNYKLFSPRKVIAKKINHRSGAPPTYRVEFLDPLFYKNISSETEIDDKTGVARKTNTVYYPGPIEDDALIASWPHLADFVSQCIPATPKKKERKRKSSSPDHREDVPHFPSEDGADQNPKDKGKKKRAPRKRTKKATPKSGEEFKDLELVDPRISTEFRGIPVLQ